MTTLAGRSAIVTGAGRGFGHSIAMALGRAGAKVTLVARTSEQISATSDEIIKRGGVSQAVVGDVGDLVSIREAYFRHVESFGPTSILINCAGVGDPVGPIGDIDIDRWWKTMAINVRAPLQLMNLAIPDMRSVGQGTIINLSSIAGLAVLPFNSGYCVSKATLFRLSEHVALENAEAGIAVFPVHPGIVFTQLMADSINDEMRRWMPDMATHFEALRNNGDGAAALERCAQHCVTLATGCYNHLNGKFLDLSVPNIEEAVIRTSVPPPAPQ